MMDTARSREITSCSDIHFAEIWRFSKISSWIWSIFSRGGHCFGSSRTRRITGGKITTFKLDHPVLTVAYDGACSPNVSVRMVWITFGVLPCKKIVVSSRLDVVEIVRVGRRASFQPLQKEKLAIRHMNRPLFPTTPSIPSYDVGK